MKSCQLTNAIVRSPLSNMGDGLTTQNLGAPDFERAKVQYDTYLQALRECGLEVRILPGDSRFPDGHFVEDTAIIYRDLAVMTQPGALARRGETQAIEQALPQKRRAYITGDGYVDGGDVLFCADRVLIGLSERTNLAGAAQLRGFLRQYDAELRVDLVSFGGVLHLKSGLTELTPGILVRSPDFESDYDFNFSKTFVLPPEESYAVNLLPLNGAVLVAKGFPAAKELASEYDARVLELDMSEFEKMDGGLTCLSLRYTIYTD